MHHKESEAHINIGSLDRPVLGSVVDVGTGCNAGGTTRRGNGECGKNGVD